jgi:glycosyltransferase involved in cell wall biosynthesis
LPFLKRADRVFAVSQFTLEQCQLRGVSREKLMVVSNCINFEYLNPFSEADTSQVISKFNINVKEKKILLTVGRLIKRKGHEWFLTNVFKNLPEQYIYIIAGLGPEYETIKQVIQNLGFVNRIYLLGHVSEEEKKCLYQISDLFIMPNIVIPGDQEGFGIVLLEAGGYGLPVIASRIEGISDAVLDRKTGRLVNEKNASGFLDAILDSGIDVSSLKDTVISSFDCAKIAKTYYSEFERMSA